MGRIEDTSGPPLEDIFPEVTGSTNTEVLDGLITDSGESFKDAVMNQILNNDIKLIVVFGPPRAGKTTIVNQLGTAIIESSGQEKTPRYLFFDNVWSDAEGELGPIEYWEDREWKAFSKYHRDAIEDTLVDLSPNEVLIAEAVSVGRTDRGVTTLNQLASDHKVDTYYVPVIGDPRIDRVDTLRRIAALAKDLEGNWRIPDEELISFYRAAGLIVSGWDGLTIDEAGRRLRKAVEKMDRPKKHTLWDLTDRAQVETKVLEYEANGLPTGPRRLTELDEILIEVIQQRNRGQGKFPPLPEQILEAVTEPWAADRFRALAEYYWIKGLDPRFSKERYVRAFNILLTGSPIHYLDLSVLGRSTSEEN